jgi:hypothetical protein
MTTDQELQEELVFKRFPAEKQELVRGLVSYAMLMGLDGRDLASIGQKLTRMDLAQSKKSNADRIADYSCLPVQKNGIIQDYDKCFRLHTLNGNYKFRYLSNSNWDVTSMSSKVILRYGVKNKDAQFRGTNYWTRSQEIHRKQLLLDIADGHLVLNF